MSYPHFDLVQRAHNELLAEGKIKQRSTPDEVNADKALLTFRAGWYSNQERSAAIGILEKLDGNNVLGYSTDLLIQTDGTFWDVATDTDGNAEPVNGGPSFDPALVPRWRWPTAELAQIESSPQPGPEPVPPAGVTLDDLHQMEQRINAHTTAEADRVIQRLNELRQEVIDFAEVAGIVLFVKWLRERDETPEEASSTYDA